jgi:hypothetical protein
MSTGSDSPQSASLRIGRQKVFTPDGSAIDMVRQKVDPKTTQIEVIVRFNKEGLSGKEAWTGGFVNLPAHPQFGIKASYGKPFTDRAGILRQIDAVLNEAGVTLK